MYVAVYSSVLEGSSRVHLGNVRNVTFKFTKRTFDFNSADLSGLADFDVSQGLIGVVNDEYGRQQFAGFIRNAKPGEGSLVKFKIDDFKRILDTDVLIDFTQGTNDSHELHDIFVKVHSGVVASTDPAITMLNIGFDVPADTSNTSVIVDYTGQYMVSNALKFLKVYLSYYNYHIKPSYDVSNDLILFEFKKRTEQVTSIRLPDFIHEKTSNDIKLNKVTAVVSFNTKGSGDPSWIDSDQTYFDGLPDGSKMVRAGSLPTPEGLPDGYGLKLFTSMDLVASNISEYNSASSKSAVSVPSGTSTCPASAPSIASILSEIEVNEYQEGHVIMAYFRTTEYTLCYNYKTYVKVVGLAPITYHKISVPAFLARPNMPSRTYTLGTDNEIYDGYAPNDKRILPVVAKIFEAQYLYEAQLNALYELANNRYVENIIVTESDMHNLANLASIDLNEIVRVYDQSGEYRDTPISEVAFEFSKKLLVKKVKLGFKKTFLTEILKEDSGEVVRQKSISGNTTIVETVFEPYLEETGNDAPEHVEVGELFFKKITN
jgi:hypothetical protein